MLGRIFRVSAFSSGVGPNGQAGNKQRWRADLVIRDMKMTAATKRRTGNLVERHKLLVETNLLWLRQALELLGQISDSAYATSPPALAPHRVRGHLRHILEF